ELPVQRVPVGERKLVTLLGCTLAQTGALRARVGLDAHPVHPDPAGGPRYGGTIHHVATTRLLAIFGAPVAQEDHARRAPRGGCTSGWRRTVGPPLHEGSGCCMGLKI